MQLLELRVSPAAPQQPNARHAGCRKQVHTGLASRSQEVLPGIPATPAASGRAGSPVATTPSPRARYGVHAQPPVALSHQQSKDAFMKVVVAGPFAIGPTIDTSVNYHS
jgi:hypothetical protein